MKNKPTYKELENHIKYLKKELNRYDETDLVNEIDFHDLFDINEIQRIQNLFAEATGTASIITYPDGTPITKPSNFCRLCNDIIRKTEKGLKNCYFSDAVIGKQNLNGPIYQPCLSGGLWDAGASISVGGKHIANWLVGQVKNEQTDEQNMLLYAKEIGADEYEFKKALDEVPVMPTEKFKKIADTLFFFANEISQKAFHTIIQKHLNDELQKAKDNLQTISDNMLDLVAVTDMKGNYKFAGASHKILGYEIEYLIGKNVMEFVHPDDLPGLQAKYADYIKNPKSSVNATYRNRCADGSYLWFETFGNLIYDNGGNPREILFNTRNITVRKQVEERLKLLKRAVEASSVSVVITDAEGHINYINPYFSKNTGYSSEEVLGRKLRILNPGKLSETDSEKLWSTIRSGNDWVGEYQNRKKNGDFYWEESVVSPILNGSGEFTHIVSISEDITERKRLVEELVVAKEKAEESDRLKSAFLANMSHEIRTPMNGILGFVELLLEPDLSSEQKEEYIKIVNDSGQRMLNTVNDIIEISKIESGMVQINLTKKDVNRSIEELSHFFKPEAGIKGIALNIETLLPETGKYILTDQNKFESVFINLIKNAIKYTRTGTIKIGCQQKDNTIEFFVKDTGIGIPKNKQEIIFEHFNQADITDKRSYEGSGLGLAISKSHVEMLGGKIWVESDPDEDLETKGSIFYFTLPYKN